MVDSAMLSRLLRLYWSPLRNFSSVKILTWPYVIAGSISSPKDHDHCDRAVKINDTCLLTKWQGRAGKSLAWRQYAQTERNKGRTWWPRPEYFPFRPGLAQSISPISILSHDHWSYTTAKKKKTFTAKLFFNFDEKEQKTLNSSYFLLSF